LVLVAVTQDPLAQQCVGAWANAGAITMRAHDAQSCVRVATAVGPDVIVLDQRLPGRLAGLLKAHPVSRTARLEFAAWPAPSVEPALVAG